MIVLKIQPGNWSRYSNFDKHKGSDRHMTKGKKMIKINLQTLAFSGPEAAVSGKTWLFN